MGTQQSQNPPGQQQGANEPGGRDLGEDLSRKAGTPRQASGSQGRGRQQGQQEGDRQREPLPEDDGVSSDDIDERNDAGSLGLKGNPGGKDKAR